MAQTTRLASFGPVFVIAGFPKQPCCLNPLPLLLLLTCYCRPNEMR